MNTEDKNRPDAIRAELETLREEPFRVFSSGLLPGVEHILGVRLPALRKIARRLAKSDWLMFVDSQEKSSFEEIMLHGMILGYVNLNFDTLLVYISRFVPSIDNWSVCDSFCVGLKAFRENREMGWDFLKPYCSSNKEFESRFALVMYIFHFVQTDYIDRIIENILELKAEGYYTKMAAAWLLAECYVPFGDKVLPLLQMNMLDVFVHNKTISKICESLKVSKEDKLLIKALRRQTN